MVNADFPGYRLLQFGEIDSTNEEAKRLGAQGETHACWIMAERQNAGRGRRARQWDSPRGNLMTTLYLPERMALTKAGFFSFIAGLALFDTVAHFITATQTQKALRLKWPNDLLFNNAKIAGILLETASLENEMISWIAIGIGLNLRYFPTDTPYPATALLPATGVEVSPLDAQKVLAARFTHYKTLYEAQGFSALRDLWMMRAQGKGERVFVRLPQATKVGIFNDINETGALILQLDNGQREDIFVGDVYFDPPDGGR